MSYKVELSRLLLINYSGQGNEKENLRDEKEYETGAAKGYRLCESSLFVSPLSPLMMFIGPTCRKMTDLQNGSLARIGCWGPNLRRKRIRRRSPRTQEGSKAVQD